MSFVDKQLTCRDCGNTFLFTGGEQEFYASKGLQNEPVRCPPCRSARKSNRLTEPEDGYVKYGVFASFGGRTPRQMHPATCADCGMMTEVPFQPRGDRPVYCSACYNKIKGAQEAEAEAAEHAALAALSGGGEKDEETEVGTNVVPLGDDAVSLEDMEENEEAAAGASAPEVEAGAEEPAAEAVAGAEAPVEAEAGVEETVTEPEVATAELEDVQVVEPVEAEAEGEEEKIESTAEA